MSCCGQSAELDAGTMIWWKLAEGDAGGVGIQAEAVMGP